MSWMWWHTPAILALRRQEDDHKFKATQESQDYIVRRKGMEGKEGGKGQNTDAHFLKN